MEELPQTELNAPGSLTASGKKKDKRKVTATPNAISVSATPTGHSSFSKFHQLKKESCRYIGEYQTQTS